MIIHLARRNVINLKLASYFNSKNGIYELIYVAGLNFTFKMNCKVFFFSKGTYTNDLLMEKTHINRKNTLSAKLCMKLKYRKSIHWSNGP